jgi:hypothetical protein
MGRFNYKVDSKHTEKWVANIGKLIVNFSVLELESHLWLVQLSEKSDQILKNANLPFMRRVNSIREYIDSRHYNKNWKSESLIHWQNAEQLAKTRNRIAHNPLTFAWNDDKEEGDPDMIGIVDMQGTKNSLKDSPVLMDHKSIIENVNKIGSTVTSLAELRKEWCEERDKRCDENTS